MSLIDASPPTADGVSEYDRRNLALYAALLDAADTGVDWRMAAADILHLNPDDANAQDCWRSHLERARWIVGAGFTEAVEAFGSTAR